MNDGSQEKEVFYPCFFKDLDFWFFRIAGCGLGNAFYDYFHTVILARKCGGAVVFPAWPTFKIKTFLRGDHSKRLYFRLFYPSHNEISGVRKFFVLLKGWRKRTQILVAQGTPDVEPQPGVNVVSSKPFSFEGLYEHRDFIRSRFLEMVRCATSVCWGSGGYIGVHVRLGDFGVASSLDVVKKGAVNTRIPLSWYVSLIKALRRDYPNSPINVFSDGKHEDLKDLLELGATLYRGKTDIDELLAMSQSSFLIGSCSTFSYWAAFLGGMPSAWLETERRDQKMPKEDGAPQFFIPVDEPPDSIRLKI